MRQFLNKYGIYIVAIGFIVAGTFWFLFNRGGATKPKSGFYLDEDTGAEVIRPLSDVPPLTGAKGNPSVVEEYKYTQGNDPTPKTGYLFKFTPEMKAKLEDAALHPDKYPNLDTSTGMLVRKADAGPNGWVKATSAEGKKIMDIDVSAGLPKTVYP